MLSAGVLVIVVVVSLAPGVNVLPVEPPPPPNIFCRLPRISINSAVPEASSGAVVSAGGVSIVGGVYVAPSTGPPNSGLRVRV